MKSLLERRNITLTFTPKALDFIAEKGYDPDYGARPLKRAIQKELQDQLALRILKGEFHEGDHIQVDANDFELIFHVPVEN